MRLIEVARVRKDGKRSLNNTDGRRVSCGFCKVHS